MAFLFGDCLSIPLHRRKALPQTRFASNIHSCSCISDDGCACCSYSITRILALFFLFLFSHEISRSYSVCGASFRKAYFQLSSMTIKQKPTTRRMGPSASLVQACSLGRYRPRFKSGRPHYLTARSEVKLSTSTRLFAGVTTSEKESKHRRN